MWIASLVLALQAPAAIPAPQFDGIGAQPDGELIHRRLDGEGRLRNAEAANAPAGGLLVKPRDVSALASAVIHVLQSAQVRQAMGRDGQATAGRYTWDRVADQVLDCYDGVFEQRLECDKAWDRHLVRRGITP